MAQLFYHLIDKYGRKKTLDFLKLVNRIICMYSITDGCVQISELSLPQPHPTVDWHIAKKVYDHFIGFLKQTNPEDVHPEFDSIFQSDPESVVFDKIAAYAERLGCSLAKSSGGHAFFNGKHLIVHDVGLRSKLQSKLPC
jgi:UDP-glucose:glycoprotein glucosyltransferase